MNSHITNLNFSSAFERDASSDENVSIRTEAVTAGLLNLRQSPSSTAAILAQLKKGEEITVKGLKGNWVHVTTREGRSGWVYNRYLTGFETAGETAQPAQPKLPREKKTLAASPPPAPQETDQPNAIQGSFQPQAEARTLAMEPVVKKAKTTKNGDSADLSATTDTVVFTRMAEPRERAFTVLIPKGWHVEGGILRVDPLAQGGPAQSIAAKLDFKIKKDAQGSVMEHWLPDTTWYDPRHSPAGQMGMIPVGGNYQGMTVMPLLGAGEFLRQVVFPRYHPLADNVKIVKIQNLPKLSQAYHYGARIVVPMLAGHLRYDAALMRVNYSEGGKRYEEMLVTVIEDMGAAGTGMWNNKLTFTMRAPLGQYKNWEPIFSVINHSIKIDHRWMAGEVRGQLERNKILDKTQKELQRIGREISEHRYKTNAEIQNDMFLTLMGQEEYVNPYTKEVEIGTDQWRHRWVNESGDVIYSNREEYNPNIDVHLNRSDYKRTPVRKR